MKPLSICMISFLILLTFACKNDERIIQPEPLEGDELIASQLDQVAHKISGSSYTLVDEELNCLNILANYRYVGMGEATHGTREFFEMKHRIFKYLVEHHGFRVFAIEADMGESYYINKYIQTGQGNARQIMSEKMLFWTWATQEVEDLIEWMKEYNQNVSSNQKLYYVGVDCQSFIHNIKLIPEYLQNYSYSLYQRLNSCLEVLLEQEFTNSTSIDNFYSNMSSSKFNGLTDSINVMINILDESRDELITNTSNYEFEIHRRLMENLRQVHFVNGRHHFYTTNENYRDKYMAENSLWSGTIGGEELKVAIWAHNGHVGRVPNYGGSGSLGNYMSFFVDNQYAVIGFSFSKGKFQAVGQGSASGNWIHTITHNPIDNSYQKIFNLSSSPSFILINSEISSSDEFGTWYSQPKYYISIGAVFNGESAGYFYLCDILEEYDIIVHFNQTREAVSIR